MSYGFKTTRQSHVAYKILAGIDLDEDALRTFSENTEGLGIKADVRAIADNPTLLAQMLPAIIAPERRPLVFIGCAPCQGFSALRKGDQRDDARNSLLTDFAKICVHFRPDVLVMENVPEVLKGRRSDYFQKTIEILRGAGYRLQKKVLDLSQYGVPQRRRRALIIGCQSGKITMPPPIFSDGEQRTVRDAISHLRPLDSGEIDIYDPYHRAPNHTDRLLARFKATPPDGGDRRSLAGKYQLPCHATIDISDAPGFTDVYGRLRWSLPSVTITAKSRSPSSGRFLHPEQHRNISVREAAILQGFPQNFQFHGSTTQQYRQIGEAVPPLFARFVAWQILDQLFPHNDQLFPSFAGSAIATDANDRSTSIGLVDGFCGAGGLGLGFRAAGISTRFAFDTDQDAVDTFRANISAAAECVDIRQNALVAKLDDVLGDSAYCISGGPPCQGFSHQRRGDADDPRNHLVLAFANLIKTLKRPPAAIILENVTDLDLPRGRKYLSAFLSQIRELGFQDFRHDLNSSDYGVPQLRKRIIIVALPRAAAVHYQGPIPTTPGRWVTVGEALAGLPQRPDRRCANSPSLANNAIGGEGALNRRRIAYVDMGLGRAAIPPDLRLRCHSTGYRGHRDVYGRLDWFSQARTITSGFDSFTRGEFAHPFQHRSITPREAARLQGFPDSFEFHGTRASIRRQIGNAVPPPVAFAIGAAIRKAVCAAEMS